MRAGRVNSVSRVPRTTSRWRGYLKVQGAVRNLRSEICNSSSLSLESVANDDGNGVHDEEQHQQHQDAGGGVLGEGGLRP
jgi:hypothetical protein